jgi:ATP-dependent DNA helicase RecG
MEEKELKKLLASGETETTEFKEKFEKESIETAVAFANTKGGIILIGVSDKGEVKGVQIRKETLKNWANQISQGAEPRVIPEIELNKMDGKNVVIIRIKEFPIKPVSVRGRCFRRVGNSNRIMPMQEIAQMHFHSTGMSWDRLGMMKTPCRFLKSWSCQRRDNLRGRQYFFFTNTLSASSHRQ